MPITGNPSIDAAPQAVTAWIEELCADLGMDDRARAYLLLRTVLHALRDSLTAAEAADLAAQLPLLWKGIWWDGWSPARAHSVTSRAAFLDRIERTFAAAPLDRPEEAVRAVHGLLERHVSEGEMAQADSVVRVSLRRLWA
jgi:uncharacterized protein (DUF2267 family)